MDKEATNMEANEIVIGGWYERAKDGARIPATDVVVTGVTSRSVSYVNRGRKDRCLPIADFCKFYVACEVSNRSRLESSPAVHPVFGAEIENNPDWEP